jgi:hypothetical protein
VIDGTLTVVPAEALLPFTFVSKTAFPPATVNTSAQTAAPTALVVQLAVIVLFAVEGALSKYASQTSPAPETLFDGDWEVTV